MNTICTRLKTERHPRISGIGMDMDTPCLLDVISDPDALNLFLNDTDDPVGNAELPLAHPEDIAATLLAAPQPVTREHPSNPSQSVIAATFLSPQGFSSVGKVAPSAAAYLQQQAAARTNNAQASVQAQYVLAGSPSPRSVPQPLTPGSVVGSPYGGYRHSSTPSPVSLPPGTPSPMPSPATTPNLATQQLKIINSANNAKQQGQIPQLQAQLLMAGGQRPSVLSQLQNVQASLAGHPGVQVLPQMQGHTTTLPVAVSNVPTSLQLTAPGNAMPLQLAGPGSSAPLQLAPQGSLMTTSGGQVIRAPQILQMSSGNKIILQGQQLLANNGQQFSVGTVGGIQQIQVQSQGVGAVNQQPPQLITSGNLQAPPQGATLVSQSPSIQAPPNINIMNLRPQAGQVIIQQGGGIVGGKQNVVLTTPGGNNIVRVAGGVTQGLQAGMLINQNPSQLVLSKGSQAPVILQQQALSGIQSQAGQQIQLTSLKPAGTIQVNNQQGQIINVQQNIQQNVVQGNVNVVAAPSSDLTATQQVGTANNTHLININGRPVQVNTHQLRQLLASPLAKLNQQQNVQLQGQSLQFVQNSSVSQTATTTTAPRTTDPNQQAVTNAAVQQNLQEIREKLAQHKFQQQPQQGPQAQSSQQPALTLSASPGMGQSAIVSSQGNSNQSTGQGQVSGAISAFTPLNAVNVTPVPGQIQQAGSSLGVVDGSIQTLLQQNPSGLVQLQRAGLLNSSVTSGNVVTLQVSQVQPPVTSTSKQQLTQFRQILPSTSQIGTSGPTVVTTTAISNTTVQLPGLPSALAKGGSAPNVNVQTLGISTQQLSQAAQISQQQAHVKVSASISGFPGSSVGDTNLSRLATSNVPQQNTLTAASISNSVISSPASQISSDSTQQAFMTSGEELVNSLGNSNIVSGAPIVSQNGSIAPIQIPQGQHLIGQPSLSASSLQPALKQKLLNIPQQQISGAQQPVVNVQQQQQQQQILGAQQPMMNVQQQNVPQAALTANIQPQQGAQVVQRGQVNSNAQPMTGVQPQQLGQPQPVANNPQIVSLQGGNPQLAGQPQQLITQQITIPNPSQPGTSRTVVIQLTHQIQQALTMVQHKIKILLAVQNRSEAQNTELRHLAEVQQKIIYHGRTQAMRSQQQLQQQQQQQQQNVQQLQPVAQNVSSLVPNQLVNSEVQPTPAWVGNVPGAPQIVQQQAFSQSNVLPVTSVPLVTVANSVNTSVVTTFATSTVVSSSETGSVASSQASATATPSAEATITDINQLPPHMKEKLRLQLAKLTPSQLDFFLKNQASILIKLVKQHQESTNLQKIQQPVNNAAQPTVTPATANQSVTSAKIIVKMEPPNVDPVMIKPKVEPPTDVPAVAVKTDVSQPAIAPKPVVKPGIKLSRKQVFQHYVTKDQKKVEEADYTQPFQNRKDVLKRLLVYHTCQVKQDKRDDVHAGGSRYEETATELLEWKASLFRKYQYLLLEDSMKHERTAEMVMLDRMFLSSEREHLAEEKKQAAEDPESFVPNPIFYLSDEEEEYASPTERKTSDYSPSSPVRSRTDASLLSPITLTEADLSKVPSEGKQSSDMSMDMPQSPGNNYTLHSSKGLKLVFKSSPLHQSGSPTPVTENFSVKSEDSGISSQQNSVETVDEAAPLRKRLRYSSEEKDAFRTSNTGVPLSEIMNKPAQNPVECKSENLPFTSYKEESEAPEVKQETSTRDVKTEPSLDWMLTDSPKSDLKDLGLSESDTAVAGLLGSDMLGDDLAPYNGGLLDDMSLEEHLNRSLGETMLPDEETFLETSSTRKTSTNIGGPQYEYISEVSDYETDTNLGEKEQELEGALGGLLSDMEQDGRDYASELAFTSQSDPYTTDQMSQSDDEDEPSSSDHFDSDALVSMGGETQSAIDSLLALESGHDFSYDSV